MTMNIERILHDMLMMAGTTLDLPPDPEACLECKHHKNHLRFEEVEGGQHCYMFKTLPESLCMQFRKAR